MKTPIGLMALALILWGWETERLWVGVLLGVALESARVVPYRLDSREAEFHRVWDLTVVLYVGAAVVCYSLWELSEALLQFLQWMPMIFFPFMALQAFSRRDEAGLATFFWMLRREKKRSRTRCNVTYPYLALSLLSASAVSEWDSVFYVGLCVVTCWALWVNRTPRLSGAVTAGLLATVCVAGYFGHIQLRRLHAAVEKRSAEWFRAWTRSAFDDLTAHTSMGRIGELKLSGRIVFQMEPDDPEAPLPLLRQASYNKLFSATWFSVRRQITPLISADAETWDLMPGAASDRWARFYMRLPGGDGLLPLPPGPARIESLPAEEVSRTQYAAVRVDNAPRHVHFTVRHGSEATLDDSPVLMDSLVPTAEQSVIATVGRELDLGTHRTPEENMERIAQFFARHFRYQTYRRTGMLRGRRQSSMRGFLQTERGGHCEYFASATVLLLREAGIPARYATGFAVSRKLRDGDRYLIRERDAHSWALAHVGGKWIDVDNTPAGWEDIEAGHVGRLGRLWDGWRNLWFEFSWWRYSTALGAWVPYLTVPLGILAVIMIRRLLRRRRGLQRVERRTGRDLQRRGDDLDLVLYRIEQVLKARGFERHDHETFRQWVGRVGVLEQFPGDVGSLEPIVALHNRHRFDPGGLDRAGQEELDQRGRAWLDTLSS